MVRSLKICNPNKIKASVTFELTNRADSGDIFVVQPSQIELPPHEHRFISCYFKPSAMQVYAANFVASVVDGTNPRTRRLEFELRGEGTLPCVTIEKPSKLGEGATLDMDFGRLQNGKQRKLPLVLRNNGIVPATVRFKMPYHAAFTSGIPLHNKSMLLEAKESRSLNVSFAPQQQDGSLPSGGGGQELESSLTINVLHNKFEVSNVRLHGEVYVEDIVFEDLPGDTEDEIRFGDMNIVSAAADGDGDGSAVDVGGRPSWGRRSRQ